jgi:hypothetical protein
MLLIQQSRIGEVPQKYPKSEKETDVRDWGDTFDSCTPSLVPKPSKKWKSKWDVSSGAKSF